MLRLRDIMTTDILTLSPGTSLRDAADLLVSRHVSGAPVLDGDRVVGVVSATDLLGFLAAPPAWTRDGDQLRASADDEDVRDWEAGGANDVEPPAQFFAEQWSASIADVTESLGDRPSPDGGRFAEYTVAEVMTRSLHALPPTADVWTAVARMREADVHRMLVMEGDTLLGVVTTTDVARAVGDGRLVRRTFVFDRPRSADVA